MSVYRLFVTAVRANLDRCNAVGAWLLLLAYAGRPLTEGSQGSDPPGSYVVLARMDRRGVSYGGRNPLDGTASQISTASIAEINLENRLDF
jgi:hypothetical protein